jgi:multicomponent Na+:H+ antiporter subunit G
MPPLSEVVVAVLCLLGTFLIVLTGVGLVRFPDVFCRMHAAGKAGTLGVILVVAAAIIQFGGTDQDISMRGSLAVLFQLLTAPAATHLLARAAYLCGYPLSERTVVDELRGYLPSRPDGVFNQE